MAAVLQTGVNLGILLGAAVVGILTLVLPPGSERPIFRRRSLPRGVMPPPEAIACNTVLLGSMR